MIISIASGKGGTGKTTVAINLALSLDIPVNFLDCDVEEPNAHIFLKPKNLKKEIVGIPVPRILYDKCNYCGKCQEVCAYNAIAVLKDKVLVFSDLCHGCGGCKLLCPENAIEEIPQNIGEIFIGKTKDINVIYGRLFIGKPFSPPVIRATKKYIDKTKINIIDAPPGTTCPVIEAVKKSDYCILVTEPTPFGLYDLKLAIEVLRKLKIPFGVIVNRAGLGDDKLDEYLEKEEIQILMKIPFDRDIAVAYSEGKNIIDVKPEYKERFKNLLNKIENK